MSLGTLRPSPLVEQATQRLREQITAGHWPVGTKLPGETTLAKTLGVGRSTVREALRALTGAGLVQPRQGAGVFVVATEAAEDWSTRLRHAAVSDVYEVRMLVEVQAARLAALRRTDADVAVLHGALAARNAAAVDGGGPWEGEAGQGWEGRFVDADIALHAAVVAAAHNPVLTDLFGEFVPALRKGLIDLVDLLDVREHDRSHGEAAHTGLVVAVERGDADAAGRILEEELRTTLDFLRKNR